MLMAKSDDQAYAIQLVRSKPQSKVLPPCVFWDFFLGCRKKSKSEKPCKESQSDLAKT